MQGTQQVISTSHEEMTLEYTKQVSEEMEQAPFVTQE
jgi:hypothetical protein